MDTKPYLSQSTNHDGCGRTLSEATIGLGHNSKYIAATLD